VEYADGIAGFLHATGGPTREVAKPPGADTGMVGIVGIVGMIGSLVGETGVAGVSCDGSVWEIPILGTRCL